MFIRALSAALSGLALFSAAPVAPAVALSEVERNAIVQIRCGMATGTAFWIGRTRLVTAWHVTAFGACSLNGAPLEIVRADRELDFAELRGPDNPVPLRFRCSGFEAGEMYRAIGFPAIGRTVSHLIATGHRDADGLREFVGEVHPGQSGGPVLRAGIAYGIVNKRWPGRSRSLSETWICRS